MVKEWVDLTDFWDRGIRIAKGRRKRALGRGTARRNWRVGQEDAGVLGEITYALYCGHSLENVESEKPDDGEDFPGVNIKGTFRLNKPIHLFLEVYKVPSSKYQADTKLVLIQIDKEMRRGRILGWALVKDLLKSTIYYYLDDPAYGISYDRLQ